MVMNCQSSSRGNMSRNHNNRFLFPSRIPVALHFLDAPFAYLEHYDTIRSGKRSLVLQFYLNQHILQDPIALEKSSTIQNAFVTKKTPRNYSPFAALFLTCSSKVLEKNVCPVWGLLRKK